MNAMPNIAKPIIFFILLAFNLIDQIIVEGILDYFNKSFGLSGSRWRVAAIQ
jgi:hypothetical protein